MPNIDLTKSQIPFWLANTGVLRVQANVPDLNSALQPGNNDIFSVSLNVSGDNPIKIGESDTVKLDFSVGASAEARLLPLWANSNPDRLKLLKGYLPDDYLANHNNELILLLILGERVGVELNGGFSYQALNSDVSLKVGQDAGYRLIRAFDASKPVKELVPEFFSGFRLPANIDDRLGEGEVIAFEYGGFLKMAASVGVGYELAGSQGIGIKDLNLVEKYDFSLLAKLSLGAGLAGRFRVTARRGDNGADWVRVQVRKSRQSRLSIAADVSVSANFDTENMPKDADEFIGSIFGVKAKNWLNMFEQVKQYSDFDELEKKLDGLAKAFVERYIGKAFDALEDNAEFTDFITRVGEIAHSYVNLENHAVTLFDRYFNVVSGTVDQELTRVLNFIKDAVSLDALEEKLNETSDEIWFDVLNQLTEGGLLEWLSGAVKIDEVLIHDPLSELKARVDKVFSIIQDAAHSEIRRIIGLAKAEFPLDEFLTRLDNVTTAKLEQWANDFADRKLVGFFERLTEKTLDELSGTAFGQAVGEFNRVLNKIDEFKDDAYAKILSSLKQNFEFQLHREYSKATENEVLFDVEINITTDVGKALMKFAGQGEFDKVMDHYDSRNVKIHSARLLHSVTRSSKTSINIVGWKKNWHYQSLSRLITESNQRIIEDDNGSLTMLASFELKSDREDKKGRERYYANFLLSFFGQSKGKLVLDPKSKQYLVDLLTGLKATYQFVVEDERTTPDELIRYLSLADDLGLVEKEEVLMAALNGILTTDSDGNYGSVSVEYNVRFAEEGLKLLFSKPLDENYLRLSMRMMVLANYVLGKDAELREIGWAYWTPGIYSLWEAQGPPTFVGGLSDREYKPISPYPGLPYPSGGKISLSNFQREILSTLYGIENSLVKAMKKLEAVLQSGGAISPADFEDKLSDFGKALQKYDKFDKGQNTMFFLFDHLIQNAAKNLPANGKVYRKSSLKITSQLPGEEKRTKMLIA